MPKNYQNDHRKIIVVGRTVVNSNVVLPSTNWKHDCGRFKNMSFAQIVQKNCTNEAVHCSKNNTDDYEKGSTVHAVKVRQLQDHSTKNPFLVTPPFSDKKSVKIVHKCKLVKNRKLVVNDNEYKVPIRITSN